MKKTGIISTFAAIIFIVVSCSDIEKKPAVKIGINIWPGYAHAFIAKEKGFFEKNGVEVELVLREDITDSTELYRHREVDGIFTLVPDVVMFNSEGIETKIVYVADYSDTGDVIIGKKEYNSLAELKGKTLSFEGVNTFSHMFVLKALEQAGVEEAEVRFENVRALDVLVALEQGRIDAGHTWEPVKSEALRNGYKILSKAGDVPGAITDVLVFNSSIIEERPDDIRAIVKSMLEARDFLYANRDESLAIMSKAEQMGKEELARGIEGIRQPDLKENVKSMSRSQEATSLYHAGKMAVDFFLNRGQISNLYDVAEMVEARFVNELAQQ